MLKWSLTLKEGLPTVGFDCGKLEGVLKDLVWQKSPGRGVQGGHFCKPGAGGKFPLSPKGCTPCPQPRPPGSVPQPWPGVWGDVGLWCMELDAEHVSETQRGFALGLESLNCTRCFAAPQQFVIKTQLAVLIRLSS